MTARIPTDKAQVSGAAAKNPQRFKDRAKPRTRPIGKPYSGMDEVEIKYWHECAEEMPWLTGSDRIMLRVVCRLSKRAEDPECGIEALRALSAALSKLGATPVDQSKVSAGDSGEDEDPTDGFFTRH